MPEGVTCTLRVGRYRATAESGWDCQLARLCLTTPRGLRASGQVRDNRRVRDDRPNFQAVMHFCLFGSQLDRHSTGPDRQEHVSSHEQATASCRTSSVS